MAGIFYVESNFWPELLKIKGKQEKKQNKQNANFFPQNCLF